MTIKKTEISAKHEFLKYKCSVTVVMANFDNHVRI